MIPADAAARLADVVQKAPGRLSVAIRADDGSRWAHDAERGVPAASTIKVAILLAALADGMPWEAPVPLPATRVGGCGPLSLLPSVQQLPAGELAALMIACSDNDAANAVLDRIGMPAVAQVLARAGARHTVVRRRMMDPAAVATGSDNVTCAADQAGLFARLRDGRLLDQQRTRLAIDLLRRQQFTDGLPAFLPANVQAASKTGQLSGLRHDVALLERGERWVSIAVLATDLVDSQGVDRGSDVLGVFARMGAIAAELI